MAEMFFGIPGYCFDGQNENKKWRASGRAIFYFRFEPGGIVG